MWRLSPSPRPCAVSGEGEQSLPPCHLALHPALSTRAQNEDYAKVREDFTNMLKGGTAIRHYANHNQSAHTL